MAAQMALVLGKFKFNAFNQSEFIDAKSSFCCPPNCFRSSLDDANGTSPHPLQPPPCILCRGSIVSAVCPFVHFCFSAIPVSRSRAALVDNKSSVIFLVRSVKIIGLSLGHFLSQLLLLIFIPVILSQLV